MPPEPPIAHEDFEAIFKEHYRPVLYWFRRQRLDQQTSEELAQETMLAAYKGLDSFRGDSSRRTWLMRIARNLFRNYLRDRRTQKRNAPEVSIDAEPKSDGPPLEVSDSRTPQDDELIKEERRETLQEGLRRMPPQMRQCLELRLRDLKYREIAEIMGISLETVKSHLHQARQRLREFFKDVSELDDPDERGNP